MTHHRLAVEIFSSVILKGKPYVRRCFPIDHVLLDAAGWVEALDGVPKGPLLVRNGPGVGMGRGARRGAERAVTRTERPRSR
ncbi:hypothetical protein QE152_g22587 [Popillia japonica]|uniref:Uncharacterized protein n=1 Tax=Popillia japonica TaxID=7064 RepID=A0AAW1KKB2_POPJA